jgi:hypothetical protein
MGEDLHHCAKSPLTSKWEKNCRFLRESLMLGKRGSSNMVNILNSVCSLRDYCVTLSVFLDEQHHLSAESPHSSEWEKHCSSVREAVVLQARGPFTLLCMVNRVSIRKERFLTVSIFKGEERQLCAKQPLSSEWRNTVAFLRTQ